jgi:hypothetical protein
LTKKSPVVNFVVLKYLLNKRGGCMRYLFSVLIIGIAVVSLSAQTAVPPALGNGTASNPYQICSLENLHWIAANEDVVPLPPLDHRMSSHYIQTDDIDASATENWFEGLGWYPIGRQATSFTGTYDGQGHTIDSLHINRPDAGNIGLFGRTEGATISNLGITNVMCNGYYKTGGLVGYNSLYSTIENCYVTGFVNGLYDNTGGITGLNYYSTVSNSYSSVNVTGIDFYTGGVAGSSIYHSAIINSYSTGTVTGSLYTGGLAGENNNNSSVVYCYSTGSVTGNHLTGGLIGGGIGNVVNSYWNTESSGLDNSGGGEGRTTQQMIQGSNYTGWNFLDHWDIENGFSYPALQWQPATEYPVPGSLNLTGTPGNMMNQLAWEPSYHPPLGYRIYRNSSLVNEDALITETNYTDTEIAAFQKQSYSITAVYENNGTMIESLQSNIVTLIPYLLGDGDGTVDDPFLVETAEHLYSARYFRESHFLQTADIDLGATPWNEGEGWDPIGTSLNSAFQGVYDGDGYSINGLFLNRPDSNYQGLWGFVITGEIRNVNLTDVSVNGNEYVGGLVAYNSGSSLISSCSSNGTVTGSFRYIGGLVGCNRGSTIEDSFSITEITATADGVGGLVGVSIDAAAINNSCSKGSIINSGLNTGGLVGFNNQSEISNSWSTVDVTNTDSRTGGLIGRNDEGYVENSYSSGRIAGTGDVGGLIGGNNFSSIESSYSMSRVNASSASAGGLIGSNSNSEIANCYSAAIVYSTSSRVGGLIGFNNLSQVHNSYSSSFVIGFGSFIGGLIGMGGNDPVTNSFWNIDNDGLESSEGGIGLTTSQMLQSAQFEGWDFDGVWSNLENVSYPALQWQDISSYPIPGPTGLSGIPGDGEIHLSWQEPYNEPLGYNIYRNGFLINEDSLITGTEYTDYIDNWEVEIYNVKAVFELQNILVESLSSRPIAVSAVLFAGGTGSAENPFLIESASDLSNIRFALHNHYRQIADISLDVTPWNSGEGWTPIGISTSERFSGTYDGDGYSINGLNINRPSSDRQGLFGVVFEASIVNVNINDAYVLANRFVGLLSGTLRDSNVMNCSSSGTVIAMNNYCGGLLGSVYNSSVTNSYSAVNVNGNHCVGGLIGESFSSSINDCFSTGFVSGNHSIGGLIGWLRADSFVENCSSNSNVNGSTDIGGFVGNNSSSTVTSSSSSGSVNSTDSYAGGLIGLNDQGIVLNSFSLSPVSGNNGAGGLIGYSTNQYSNQFSIRNCYSTGMVSGASFVGGFLGRRDPDLVIENSYWNTETSGQSFSPGGYGRSTAEMTYPYSFNTYVDWDFTEIWAPDSDYSINNGYPYLLQLDLSVEEEEDTILEIKQITLSNHPNPFNPETMIVFQLPQDVEKLELTIYNIKGELVRTLVPSSPYQKGEHRIIWGGRNNHGRGVSSGIYFYRISTPSFNKTNKMMMLK